MFLFMLLLIKWCVLHTNFGFLLKAELASLPLQKTVEIIVEIKIGLNVKGDENLSCAILYASIESIEGALFVLICFDLFGCKRKASL